MFRDYLYENQDKLAFAILLILYAVFFDASVAMGAAMILNASPLEKALSDHTNALKEFMEKAAERQKSFDVRLVHMEQKMERPTPGSGNFGEHHPGELTDLVLKSDGLAAFQKGVTRSVEIAVPGKLFKTAILNATGQNQPLVPADRRSGIIVGPQRRFTIRDLFPGIPTQSNSVEFCRENVFTNNAGPQGGGSSPAETEGQLKNESGITFTLANTPVVTLAHWIPASRQVLSDAPALQQHVEHRLLYGLKLEEENELLNGAGTNGELNGLIQNATGFNRGSTNLSALDAIALAIAQLIGSDYEPSGIILNPNDWYSTKFLLSKNDEGEYLLGNPASMAEPRLWGLPVVVTNTMPQGYFMVLDAQRVGYIADREDAIVRIAEQHADFFVRNMVAILVEERLAIVIQLGAAMVYGSLNYAG